jgi:hypothetical protein
VSKGLTNLEQLYLDCLNDRRRVEDVLPGLSVTLYKYPRDVVRKIALKQKERFQSSCMERQLRTRRYLAKSIESFHRDSNTLDDKTREILHLLENQDTIIILTAHQPNLFPYGGVLKKIVFLDFLRKELETEGIASVPLFAIADHDFVHNKWIRSAELPAPLRKEGVLRLTVPIPKNASMQLVKNVPKPSAALFAEWKRQLESWIKENYSVGRRRGPMGSGYRKTDTLTFYENNFSEFWSEVELSYADSANLADFSSFTLARICKNFWNSSTLFFRFSDAFPFFLDECEQVLRSLHEYKTVLRSSEKCFISQGLDTGLGEESNEDVVPFWIECNCGSKHSLFLQEGSDGNILLGKCLGCKREEVFCSYGKKEDIDLSQLSNRLSPRAVSMILVYSRGMNVACYVGGFGSFGYLLEARRISQAFNWPYPELVVWQPKDEYQSLAKLCALKEYNRISRESVSLFGFELPELEDIYRDGVDQHSAEFLFDCMSVNIDQFRNRYERLKAARSSNSTTLTPLSARELRELNVLGVTYNIRPSSIDIFTNLGVRQTYAGWMQWLRMNMDLAQPTRFPTKILVSPPVEKSDV